MRSPEEIGNDLKAAREAWGLSQEALAEQVDIPAGDVSAAEAGQATISELDDLARALGGSLDELMQGNRFWEAPAVAFRNFPDMADRSQVRAALARVSLAVRTRAWLTRLIDQPDPWPQTREKLAPVALADDVLAQAEALAERVRTHIGNRAAPIVSLREVMRELGVATFLSDFGTKRVDGMVWRERLGESQIVCAAANTRARKGRVTALRVTLAHELCHALFDGEREHPVGLVERRDTARSEGLEQRANAFAIHLLAPRAAVANFLRSRGVESRKPTARHVQEMSIYFILGVEACANHLVSLRYWSKQDVRNHRGLWSPQLRGLRGVDAAELYDEETRDLLPLELRGDVLELATTALSQGHITPGRWREVLGLHPLDEWSRLLPDEPDEGRAPGEHEAKA